MQCIPRAPFVALAQYLDPTALLAAAQAREGFATAYALCRNATGVVTPDVMSWLVEITAEQELSQSSCPERAKPSEPEGGRDRASSLAQRAAAEAHQVASSWVQMAQQSVLSVEHRLGIVGNATAPAGPVKPVPVQVGRVSLSRGVGLGVRVRVRVRKLRRTSFVRCFLNPGRLGSGLGLGLGLGLGWA